VLFEANSWFDVSFRYLSRRWSNMRLAIASFQPREDGMAVTVPEKYERNLEIYKAHCFEGKS
jgi:hypothetical protein